MEPDVARQDSMHTAVHGDEGYHLILKGGGLALDRNVTEHQAWAVLGVVFGQPGAKRLSAMPAPDTHGRGGARQQHEEHSQKVEQDQQPPQRIAPEADLTVGEFIEQCEATSNPEKIVAISMFLRNYAGHETISRNDVRAQFQRAGEPIPANFHRDFVKAVSSKWISTTTDGKNYFITGSGRKAVENKFSTDTRKVASSTRRRRPPKKPADDE